MGSQLLTTGSVLAAFFAGGVALFAPCCIVFLAPSYLAGAVKNRRWRLLPLTFVFAAGLATVLLPITLGVSMVAGAIAKYHAPLYYAGGVLMLALAAFALSGRMWSLPSALRAPDTRRGDTGSFYALGVFSGIASSCCAPVLAGVMTLSALSGSPGGGLLLGIAYVFGMVFPLFVMALIWDKARLRERRWMTPKIVRLHAAGRTLVTNSLNLAVAIGFTVMGVVVMLLADSPDMTRGTAAQAAIGRGLTALFSRLERWSDPVPEPVLGLALVALAAVFVWGTLSERRRTTKQAGANLDAPGETPPTPADADGSCHGKSEGAAR